MYKKKKAKTTKFNMLFLFTFSFFQTLGSLQRSIDEGLSGLKGSNPIPTAVVFGRVL